MGRWGGSYPLSLHDGAAHGLCKSWRCAKMGIRCWPCERRAQAGTSTRMSSPMHDRACCRFDVLQPRVAAGCMLVQIMTGGGDPAPNAASHLSSLPAQRIRSTVPAPHSFRCAGPHVGQTLQEARRELLAPPLGSDRSRNSAAWLGRMLQPRGTAGWHFARLRVLLSEVRLRKLADSLGSRN